MLSERSSEEAENQTLAAAMIYREMGLSVIPVESRTKKADCTWARFQSRQATEHQLRVWFECRPDRNVGIVTGEVSGGIVARDFDDMQAYALWASRNPALAAKIPTVATPHGRHVYFRTDVSGLSTVDLGDGEFRCGSYCVAPPSVLDDGGEYRWLVAPHAFPILTLDEAGVSVPRGSATQRYFTSVYQQVGDAILRTIPDGPGTRHWRLFAFARLLKAIPELATKRPHDLREHVQRWHRAALDKITTKDFDITFSDFRDGWDRIRCVDGATVVDRAAQEAASKPVPACADKYAEPRIRWLVATCRELQRVNGSRPFFLSCRDVARIIGGDPEIYPSAARWMKTITRDGVIAKVKDSHRRKATEYRYLPDLAL